MRLLPRRKAPEFACHVWRSKYDGRWFFTVVAANNEKVAQSEGYERRIDAVTIAEKLSAGHWTVTVEGNPT